MTIVVHIPGEPVAAPRPRAGKHGVYDAKAKLKKEHAELIRQQLPEGHVAWKGPVSLQLRFAMPIRKSMTKAQKDKAFNGLLYHIKKGDIDNYVKHVLDVLTQAGLWVDDSQVAMLMANKLYRPEPGTAITAYELPV